MSNFDWENIEKEAGRKKFITAVIILVILTGAIFYYRSGLSQKTEESIITEEILQDTEAKVSDIHRNKGEEKIYTVKIGRFIDFDAARTFVINNEISDFNIYREDEDIYVNAGRINSFEEASDLKEQFIKNGFPAIIEIYSEHGDTIAIDKTSSMDSKNEIKKVDEEEIEKIDEKYEEEMKEVLEKENLEPEVIKEIVEKKVENENDSEKINNKKISEPYKDVKELSRKGYTIQVAAFAELKDATMMKNRLRFNGIDPLIVKEGGYFKVQIGLFENRKEAQAFVDKYDKKVIPDYYIKRVER